MKAYVHVFLVAACLVACARGLPGARRDEFEDDDIEGPSGFDFAIPDYRIFSTLTDTMNKFRQNMWNYFWNIPDITDIKIPEGANTTSTVKIIDGHVVTINETTYTSTDENGGSAFRIRIIDVKPQDDNTTINGGAEPTTVRAEPTESIETIEDFNNEIPKNADKLTA